MCFTTFFLTGLLATVPITSASTLNLYVRQDLYDWDNITQAVGSRRKDNDTLRYFDRDICLGFAEWLIEDGAITGHDRRIFANSSNGLLNGTDNMALTYHGCELICGKMTYYGTVEDQITIPHSLKPPLTRCQWILDPGS